MAKACGGKRQALVPPRGLHQPIEQCRFDSRSTSLRRLHLVGAMLLSSIRELLPARFYRGAWAGKRFGLGRMAVRMRRRPGVENDGGS